MGLGGWVQGSTSAWRWVSQLCPEEADWGSGADSSDFWEPWGLYSSSKLCGSQRPELQGSFTIHRAGRSSSSRIYHFLRAVNAQMPL